MRSFLPLLCSLPFFFSSASVTSASSLTWKTFDISSLLYEETTKGVSYQDASGTTQALEDLVATAGANSIKIRLWVNPSDGVYNLDYGVELGKRATAAGLDVVLNLHYSDTWADAGDQATPSAWEDLGIDDLASTVQNYTTTVLNTFVDAGVTIPLIGLGNEIRSGMLFPLGSNANNDFTNLGTLLSAAIAGVRASSSPDTLTMTHLDEGYSWETQQWWYEALAASGTFDISELDVQGVSYYPYWDKTASTLSNFEEAVTGLVKAYNKPVVVVETDWPTECEGYSDVMPASLSDKFAFSAEGQDGWMQDVAGILEGLGVETGLMYWEPAWIDNASLGSGCESVVMVTGSWSGDKGVGKIMESFNVFQDL